MRKPPSSGLAWPKPHDLPPTPCHAFLRAGVSLRFDATDGAITSLAGAFDGTLGVALRVVADFAGAFTVSLGVALRVVAVGVVGLAEALGGAFSTAVFFTFCIY